ncbi:phosphatase PAP2 family protein [uncultured Azohydromonas sp.]|jgi:PAP2 (acid phosphatase) superfamily protein|uniref:phosphatase PAP2 family protein n=1 Tax=uncultured Azohydromonas sp. TaxID=487342 RepID=UPI00261AA94A|nr:phosphatase PAP2 family protein [uncultured Azohydromonas sp.]
MRVALLALALLAAWEATGWDRTVARWLGDAAGFPMRDAWLTSTLLHNGGRRLAWAALALSAWDAIRPWQAGPSRKERLYWLGVTVAGSMLVPGIKRLSDTSCPWDLAEFGGHTAYVPHWAYWGRDGGPGHCFPSGHAVAAFAFLSLYFLWRPYRPVLARWLLFGVVGLGLMFGWVQLARGAHFPSHTFWSAWLCWALCTAAAARQQHLHRCSPRSPIPVAHG